MLFFFGNLSPGFGRYGIRNENFYLSFTGYFSPVWIEILPEWFFYFFDIFFCNFLARVWMEQNLEWIFFFFIFLGLSPPSLDRNNAGMMFFSFLNFFAIFWEFFSPGRVGMEFGTKFFFPLSRPIFARFE